MNFHKVFFKTVICICFSVSPLFSQELRIENGETMVYKISKKDGTSYNSKTTYNVSELDNEVLFSYLNQDEFSTWKVITDKNAIPREINFSSKGNQMDLVFDGNGKVDMTGLWNGGIVEKVGQFNESITLENALVARTLDFESQKNYEFDLLQTDKFPDLKSFKMYFKVIGEESVTVNAGTFHCKKVLFSITGIGGLFYKAYYYISNDEHRYIVKMKNMPMNCDTELEQIYMEASNE